MAISEKNVLYIQAYMVFYIEICKNLVLFHKLILQHFDKSSNYVKMYRTLFWSIAAGDSAPACSRIM